MVGQPRNRRTLPRMFQKRDKVEEPVYNDPVAESLNRSRANLDKVNKNISSSMSKTREEVSRAWSGQHPPKQEPVVETPKPEVHPDHQEAYSDYDYESPYGRHDKNNYHAVCIDINDKIYFLASESKDEMEQKINSDDNIKDVLAVYGGNLMYFHERRYLHLS